MVLLKTEIIEITEKKVLRFNELTSQKKSLTESVTKINHELEALEKEINPLVAAAKILDNNGELTRYLSRNTFNKDQMLEGLPAEINRIYSEIIDVSAKANTANTGTTNIPKEAETKVITTKKLPTKNK